MSPTGPTWDRPPVKRPCHEPRYWSAMDWYKATLLQGKQAQDMSLGYPCRLRPRWTMGNSCGHSLVQFPECGNKSNQAWESCTTIRQSGDRITLLQMDPHFFFLLYFLSCNLSCDHHVIMSVTIVQVTYCPFDAIVLWPIVQVTFIVPVMFIVLVTLLF